MSDLMNVQRWQHGRVVYYNTVNPFLPGDSAILSDLSLNTAATHRTKMFGVGRAGAIMLRAFGGNAEDLPCAGIQISGWGEPSPPNGEGNQGGVCSPGVRLWEGDLLTGNQTVSYPHTHPDWKIGNEGSSPPQVWKEVDTWTATYNPFGAVAYDSQNPSGAADKEAILVLPTLGLSHILIMVLNTSLHPSGSGKTRRIGFIWKPMVHNDVRLTF